MDLRSWHPGNNPANNGVNTSCADAGGTRGYASYIYYTITSFFGLTMTNTYINEQFGSRFDVISGNDWASPTAVNFETSNGSISDRLCAFGYTNPTSLQPQSPLSSTEVFTNGQHLYVGSLISGNGIFVQSDTQIYYVDHGVHSGVTSPVR